MIKKMYFMNLVVLATVLSCRSDKIETYTGEKISYKDSVFLEIKGDLNYPDVIWGGKDVWIQALVRMERHQRIVDNRFVWNVQNGAQIKISENIYEYIVRWWGRENKKLENGKYKLIHVEGNRYFAVDTTRHLRFRDTAVYN